MDKEIWLNIIIWGLIVFCVSAFSYAVYTNDIQQTNLKKECIKECGIRGHTMKDISYVDDNIVCSCDTSSYQLIIGENTNAN